MEEKITREVKNRKKTEKDEKEEKITTPRKRAITKREIVKKEPVKKEIISKEIEKEKPIKRTRVRSEKEDTAKREKVQKEVSVRKQVTRRGVTKREPEKKEIIRNSRTKTEINKNPITKRENKIENTIKRDFVTTGRRRAKSTEHSTTFRKSRLKIIPLGGLHEIGKNITVFEYENDMIAVDCGISFPEDDMLGVDLVIPDITYILKKQEKFRGLVITHGHEDHIGGVPYFLKQLNAPIYGTKLTLGLIKNKLEEHKLTSSAKLNEVSQGDTIKLGKFKIEFIRSSHSIPDSVMLAITTPVGTILHTGDFKVDFTPIDGKIMDFGRIAELGNKGILALMSDSTNSERKGFTMSESSVGEVFDRLFLNCTKRIVVATFASNVHRVQQIVNSAIKYKRKIAVCGRSMINMITTARELGYIECPDNLFIDIDMINNYTDEQLVIITTGSQGEPMSALTRMASGTHKKVKISQNDLVIISATPIPGNEKYVSKVIDELMQIGSEVVYSALEDIHVSGHACQEEQKLIFALAKPKYFIPVHGDYRHLVAHSETAKSMGIDKDNIFMLENGLTLEISKEEAGYTERVQSGKILVDGLGIGDVGSVVLRDRQHLSQDGLIVVVLTLAGSTGEVIAGPDIISRGFIYVKDSENIMEGIKAEVRQEVSECEMRGIRDWTTIKNVVRDNLRDYVFYKTKRNPMIIPIIMEV